MYCHVVDKGQSNTCTHCNSPGNSVVIYVKCAILVEANVALSHSLRAEMMSGLKRSGRLTSSLYPFQNCKLQS